LFSFIGIVGHKKEAHVNYFELAFESSPKKRWVEESDRRLGHFLIDEFLRKKHAMRNTCNSAVSKVTCISKRRTYGILVSLF
jgi:hypothetical protein